MIKFFIKYVHKKIHDFKTFCTRRCTIARKFTVDGKSPYKIQILHLILEVEKERERERKRESWTLVICQLAAEPGKSNRVTNPS